MPSTSAMSIAAEPSAKAKPGACGSRSTVNTRQPAARRSWMERTIIGPAPSWSRLRSLTGRPPRTLPRSPRGAADQCLNAIDPAQGALHRLGADRDADEAVARPPAAYSRHRTDLVLAQQRGTELVRAETRRLDGHEQVERRRARQVAQPERVQVLRHPLAFLDHRPDLRPGDRQNVVEVPLQVELQNGRRAGDQVLVDLEQLRGERLIGDDVADAPAGDAVVLRHRVTDDGVLLVGVEPATGDEVVRLEQEVAVGLVGDQVQVPD